jgi:hypothetical protein
VRGIALGAAAAALVACASAGRKSTVAAPPSAGADAGAVMPGGSPEHAEIAQLDQAITDELTKRGLAVPAEATCGPACDMAAIAMDSKPVTQDPRMQSCKPGASDTCQDSCTLSDSICKNADRICTIAHQLGDRDAYANDKCVRGSQSCQASKQRCCSCL